MAEQTNSGTGSTSQSGSAHPAQASNPVRQAANPPPAGAEGAIDRTRGAQSQNNPHNQGFRPAPAWQQGQQRQSPDGQGQQRQQGQPGVEQQGQEGQQQGQQPGADAQTIDVDGTAFTPQQIREAIAHKVEQEAKRAALPAAPDKYEVKLPADFESPADVKFEFNKDDPLLARARELAHKRGLSQEDFSDFLSVYAANEIGKHQQLATAREAQRALLGSAVDNRISAIDTWLRARVGADAALLTQQLRQYPVAAHVRLFESLMRQFSDQGSASYSQSGRQEQESTAKIPNYEGMSFSEKRAAQDRLRLQGRG